MDIYNIIIKSLYATLAADEQQALACWLKVGDHQKAYARFRDNILAKDDAVALVGAIDVDTAYTRLMEHLEEQDSQQEPAQQDAVTSGHRHLWHALWLHAAAVTLVIIAAGALTYWSHDSTRVMPPVLTAAVEHAMHTAEAQGMNQATTTTVTVDPIHFNIIAPQQVSPDASADDGLTADDLLKAQCVTTYHQHDFWTTLEDGTVVHLNYSSRLIYPEHFRGTRDVALEGEAYFMVAHDKSRPFIVHTIDGDVRVYGTEFMVTAPKGEAATTVVLVRGSVGITTPTGEEAMLRPGDEATVKGDVTVRAVDTSFAVAWNTGEYDFHDAPLERVLRVVGKWYGSEVEFESDADRYVIVNGVLSRYDDIATTRESLEMVTGLKIRVSERKITVQSGR